MNTKAWIPLKLEPGKTYQIVETDAQAPIVGKLDGLTNELKVTFTNGAVLYATLEIATPVEDTFTLKTSAAPMTS